MYRCRKCRQNLDVQDSVMKEIPYCTDTSASQSSVLYLDVETCPGWILQSFEQASWTKGKLLCVKCNGRLGSFDFIYKKVCKCLQHPVPLVHILRDRIDEIEIRHIPRTPLGPQHRQFERPKSCINQNAGSDNTAEGNKESVNDIPHFKMTDNGKKNSEIVDKTRESQENNQQSARSNFPLLHFSLLEPHNNIDERHDILPDTDINLLKLERDSSGDKNNCLNPDLNLPEFEDIVSETNSFGMAHPYASLHVEEPKYEDDFEELDVSVQRTDVSENKRHNKKERKNRRLFKAFKKNKTKKLKAEINNPDNLKEEEENDSENIKMPEEWKRGGHDIPVDFTCCICLELYYSPHRLDPCKHIFCENCLRMVCRQTPTLTRCPLCRKLIHKCVFDNDLTEDIKEQYRNLYKQRRHEIRRNETSYPLPSATRRQQRMDLHWQRNGFQDFRAGRLEQDSVIYIARRCFGDIVKRFAWLLLLLVIHNIMFVLDSMLMWDVYAPISVKYNSYLFKLAGKLILFGIFYILKKTVRIDIDHTIGHMVSFVFIFSVLLDGNSWVNSLLNLAMIGSLFL